MWGTRAGSAQGPGRSRFIPTHVGNTIDQAREIAQMPVHPHACGEHQRSSWLTDQTSGSSPRMWGTRIRQREQIQIQRFIPTHVGNTNHPARACHHKSVHPHACGEHIMDTGIMYHAPGSSPRMWGTHLKMALSFLRGRFIPTHVGNTYRWKRRSDDPTVHPHACGEHGFVSWMYFSLSGSSPRMWGTLR